MMTLKRGDIVEERTGERKGLYVVDEVHLAAPLLDNDYIYLRDIVPIKGRWSYCSDGRAPFSYPTDSFIKVGEVPNASE